MLVKLGRAYSNGRQLSGFLNTENGRFAEANAGEAELDLSAYITFPGFVDMHTHGGVGVDCSVASFDELDRLSDFYASNGVATFCATTVTSAPDVILKAVTTIADRIDAGTRGANIAGIYLEGPYISEKFRGAHDAALLRGIELSELREIVSAARGNLRVLTLAPELENAVPAIEYLTQNGVRVSLGHTAATEEEAERGFDAGATIAVHTYNAMKGLHHRDVGLLGVSLTREDVYNEIICDLIHVTPRAIDIVYRCKSHDRIVLITDSMSATGMADGNYTLGELPVIVKDGIVRTLEGALGGSSLRTNIALKNVVQRVGIPIERAMLGATSNPAAALGLGNEIGSLRNGYRAHLTALDENFNVVLTMVDGKIVYKA